MVHPSKNDNHPCGAPNSKRENGRNAESESVLNKRESESVLHEKESESVVAAGQVGCRGNLEGKCKQREACALQATTSFFFNKEKSKELDLCLTLYFWVV